MRRVVAGVLLVILLAALALVMVMSALFFPFWITLSLVLFPLKLAGRILWGTVTRLAWLIGLLALIAVAYVLAQGVG